MSSGEPIDVAALIQAQLRQAVMVAATVGSGGEAQWPGLVVEQVRGTEAQTVPQYSGSTSWKTAVKPPEVTSGYRSVWVFAGGEDDQLKTRVAQLERTTQVELKRLAAAVEQLRAVVHAGQDEVNNSSGVALLGAKLAGADLAAVEGSGLLTKVLNMIADGDIDYEPDLAPRLASYLNVDDPTVRAAGGRALSVVDQALARRLLPAAIAKERNRFAAAILRASLANA